MFSALLADAARAGSSPTAITEAATAVTGDSATLNGLGYPNGQETTGWFRYSTLNPVTCDDTFGTRAPDSGGTPLGAGFSNVPFDEDISGLSPGTNYYFCAIDQNGSSTGYGDVQTFTTSSPPTVTSLPATSIGLSTATLQGSADPRSHATTGWFRYSSTDPGACDDLFGTRAPDEGGSALGAGSAPVGYSEGISGLVSGTTYYYCAIAQSEVGTSFGDVAFFAAAVPASPTVTTGVESGVTPVSAVFHGSGDPNLGDATGWYRYSDIDPGTCIDSFGTRAPESGGAPLGAGDSPVAFQQMTGGLTPSTTYYFCAIAQNSQGTGFGDVASFSTLPVPIVSSVNTVSRTADDLLTEGERTATGISQFLVSFSAAMYDAPGDTAPNDVTNPANYRVYEAGPDGQFQSGICAAAAGDDSEIPVATARYFAADQLAAARFADGGTLGPVRHRLDVCATLVDATGYPVAPFSRTFDVLADDRILNGSFDEDFASWTIGESSPGTVQWSTDDGGAAPSSGSARVTTVSGAFSFFALSQCIPVPGHRFLTRLSARIDSATAGAPTAAVSIKFFSGAGCSGDLLAGQVSPAVAGDTGDLWATSTLQGIVPAGALSIAVEARIDGGPAASFTAALDDVYYADTLTLFADGFESGDPLFWSSYSGF